MLWVTVAVLAAAAPAQAADAPNPSPAEILNSPDSTPGQREDAARFLLDHPASANSPVIRNALQSGNQAIQLPVLQAISEQATPDPAYLPALTSLLTSGRPLTEAAADALANYPDQPQAITTLIQASTSTSLADADRASIVRAMGALMDKSVAQRLIQLLDDNSHAVQAAAGDALIEISGLTENAHDRARWQQWWAANQGKSDAQSAQRPADEPFQTVDSSPRASGTAQQRSSRSAFRVVHADSRCPKARPRVAQAQFAGAPKSALPARVLLSMTSIMPARSRTAFGFVCVRW